MNVLVYNIDILIQLKLLLLCRSWGSDRDGKEKGYATLLYCKMSFAVFPRDTFFLQYQNNAV